MIRELVVDGATIPVDVADAVTDAIHEESTTDIGSLTIELADPGFRILKAGVFAKRAPATYAGERLRVSEVTTGGDKVPTLTVKLSNRGAFDLQNERTGFAPGAPPPELLTDYAEYMREAASRVGLAAHVQPPVQTGFSLVRISTPGQYESTWELGEEGAQKWGWWLFEAGGTLFFGKPSWLLSTAPRVLTVGWAGSAGTERDAVSPPRCQRFDAISATGLEEARIVEVAIDLARSTNVHPGSALALSGVVGFDGRYLVSQVVRKPETNEPARVTAVTAVDPFVDITAVDGSAPDVPDLPHVEDSEGPFDGGSLKLSDLLFVAQRANVRWPFIRTVEMALQLPDYLLFAVGVKETRLTNEVGDHGHGHGVWQLDDRSHDIPAGFDADVPAQCQKAAAMLRALIDSENGNLVAALNRYNSGQTLSQNTTRNYGPDVSSMRQALENHLSEWT